MRPSSRSRRGIVVIALALVGAAFFFFPALAWVGGKRATQFENHPLAAFPSLSRGFGFFDGLNRWTIDRLPLRASAVRLRTRIYRNVFAQEPPATLNAGPVGTGRTGNLGGETIKPAPTGELPGALQPIAGKGGWLYIGQEFVNACVQPPPSQVVGGLRRFADIVRASGRRVVVLIPPDKATIYPAALPGVLPARDCWRRGLAARSAALSGTRIPGYVDLAALLARRQARDGRPIYLPDDTHWTEVGSVLYATALARAVDPALLARTRIVRGGTQRYVGDLRALTGDPTPSTEPAFRIVRRGIRTVTSGSRDWQQMLKGGVIRSFGRASGLDPAPLERERVTILGDSFTQRALPDIAPFFRRVTSLPQLVEVNPERRRHVLRLLFRSLNRSRIVVVEQTERMLFARRPGSVWLPGFLDRLQRSLRPIPPT